MHIDLAKLSLKTGLGLIGATIATNDIPQIYATLDPHITFASRLGGLVLCALSIWAVCLTIRKRRMEDGRMDATVLAPVPTLIVRGAVADLAPGERAIIEQVNREQQR